MNDTESNRVAAKSKRGRKPARESRSGELRQLIAQWKSAPPGKRGPRTLTALAEELGISHQLASYYATTPEERWRRQLEQMYREALAVVYDSGTDRQRRQIARQALRTINPAATRRNSH